MCFRLSFSELGTDFAAIRFMFNYSVKIRRRVPCARRRILRTSLIVSYVVLEDLTRLSHLLVRPIWRWLSVRFRTSTHVWPLLNTNAIRGFCCTHGRHYEGGFLKHFVSLWSCLLKVTAKLDAYTLFQVRSRLLTGHLSQNALITDTLKCQLHQENATVFHNDTVRSNLQ